MMKSTESQFLHYLIQEKILSKFDEIRVNKDISENTTKALCDSIVDTQCLSYFELSTQLKTYFRQKETITSLSDVTLSDNAYELDIKEYYNNNVFPARIDEKEVYLVYNPFSTFVQELSGFTVVAKPLIEALFNKYRNLVSDISEGRQTVETRDELSLFIRNTVISAYERGASDIHVIPTSDEACITFRVDGDVTPYKSIKQSLYKRFIKMIENDPNVELSGSNNCTDRTGVMEVNLNGKEFRLRLNLIPSQYGVDLNMRFLYRDVMDFNTLGLTENKKVLLRKLFNRRQGMILFCGSVGSGKSTTIYSILKEIKDGLTICSAEDPVEIKIDGLTQVTVTNQFTYPSIIKSFLRHDPDIIVVSETRDKEVAYNLRVASETGSLVVSSIHTKSALGTISRLRGLGMSNQDISDNVIAIVYQRLVKRATGGRVLVADMVVIDNELQSAILKDLSVFELESYLTQENHYSYLDELDYLLAEKIITDKEYAKAFEYFDRS